MHPLIARAGERVTLAVLCLAGGADDLADAAAAGVLTDDSAAQRHGRPPGLRDRLVAVYEETLTRRRRAQMYLGC